MAKRFIEANACLMKQFKDCLQDLEQRRKADHYFIFLGTLLDAVFTADAYRCRDACVP